MSKAQTQLFITHDTRHIMRYALHIMHCRLYIAHNTLHVIHCTFYIMYSAKHYALHIMHCTFFYFHAKTKMYSTDFCLTKCQLNIMLILQQTQSIKK